MTNNEKRTKDRVQVREYWPFGRRNEVVKVWNKCGICLKENSYAVYFPFRSGERFSLLREDIDAEDSIQICRHCEYLIYQIRRANFEAFSEAVTIGDFAEVVRKVYRL